VKQQKVEALIS